MARKTYTVKDLLEWQFLLPADGSVLRIHFSGGHMDYDRIHTGTYTTDNAAVQRMIENSEEYRTGKIRKI